MTNQDIASKIDHTILKPTTTHLQIDQLCEEALQYSFAAVCVPPNRVEQAVKKLKDSSVKVATVIGFPFGYNDSIIKMLETNTAIESEVDEVDIVANIGAIKEHNWEMVRMDLLVAVQLCQVHKITSKIIIETGLLSKEEIVKMCIICAELQVDYVKTSTGFNGEGATIEVIKLMRVNLPKFIKIKASGGIRTREFAVELIEAGADRLGCSSGVKIVSEN
ncbi:MAG: deoxyribose-phosphate aldolase [Chitinophagales bacterium]